MKTLTLGRGFTLIELLVVIAIIGLLASTVLASLSRARTTARDTQGLQQAKELMKALELYRNANNGLYPCSGPASGSTLNCAANLAWGAYESRITRGTTGPTYTAIETLLRSGLSFTPPLNTNTDPALFYISRNTGAPNNYADRSSYTILVGAENEPSYTTVNNAGTNFTAMKYCKITSGTADTNSQVGGIGNGGTMVSAIVDCPVKGVQ